MFLTIRRGGTFGASKLPSIRSRSDAKVFVSLIIYLLCWSSTGWVRYLTQDTEETYSGCLVMLYFRGGGSDSI